VILRWPHRLPLLFRAAVKETITRRASSRADTRRALPPPLRRSARRSMARRMADGKEWSLWWSPFPLTGGCHLTRWLLPTLPDRLAAPRSLRSAALHSAPFPRTTDGLVSWLRATGRRHGPRGEGMRPERAGRSELVSERHRRTRETQYAVCSHGYGGDRHGGRWTRPGRVGQW
jgi:hypothetical protein